MTPVRFFLALWNNAKLNLVLLYFSVIVFAVLPRTLYAENQYIRDEEDTAGVRFFSKE